PSRALGFACVRVRSNGTATSRARKLARSSRPVPIASPLRARTTCTITVADVSCSTCRTMANSRRSGRMWLIRCGGLANLRSRTPKSSRLSRSGGIGRRSVWRRRGAERAAMGRWAVEQLGDVRGQTVWDLYGGIGDTAAMLVERGANVVSVDADEKAIQWARERLPGEAARFIAARAEDVLPSLPAPHAVVVNP